MCAYFAVGVPRVLRGLPEDGGARHEAVLSLSFAHCGSALLAVVTTTTLQVWGGGQVRRCAAHAPRPSRSADTHAFLSHAQHRVKLAEYARDAASLSVHGVNLQAVWRPDHAALALLVRR